MNVLRSAAAVPAAALLLLMTAGAASAAPARSLPVVYSDVAAWTGPAVEPISIFVGTSASNAPYILHIRWTHWSGRSARGVGTLYPSASTVVVTLQGIRKHDGRGYFWQMAWKRHQREFRAWEYKKVPGAAWNPEWKAVPVPRPIGCHPLTSSGHCYEPGEFCPAADHGMSGVAGDGKKIACEDNDGWRWEPAS